MTTAFVILALAAAVNVRRMQVLLRRLRHVPPGRWAADAGVDELAVAELVAVGLSAGLPFAAALATVEDDLGESSGWELRVLLRRLHAGGIAEVLEHHDGRLGRLALIAGRAQLTGAPVLAAIEAFIDEHLDAERSRRLAAARRLPVQLALPLALLILPGFVLLVTAPAVFTTLARLGLSTASP